MTQVGNGKHRKIAMTLEGFHNERDCPWLGTNAATTTCVYPLDPSLLNIPVVLKSVQDNSRDTRMHDTVTNMITSNNYTATVGKKHKTKSTSEGDMQRPLDMQLWPTDAHLKFKSTWTVDATYDQIEYLVVIASMQS